MPSRFYIHYVSKSGRSSSGHRTRKGQSSSQFPRRVVPKNVLNSRQLHSSPALIRSCLKSCMLGFSVIWTKNFQMSKLGLKKEEELEINQSASIRWIIEKAREFQKNICLCFIDYTKAFDCVDHNKLWSTQILEKWEYQTTHLTYLLRNLYAGQETTVRTRHGTTNLFKIGKGVWQGCCILSPCLFKLYAEYIMQNARLD